MNQLRLTPVQIAELNAVQRLTGAVLMQYLQNHNVETKITELVKFCREYAINLDTKMPTGAQLYTHNSYYARLWSNVKSSEVNMAFGEWLYIVLPSALFDDVTKMFDNSVDVCRNVEGLAHAFSLTCDGCFLRTIISDGQEWMQGLMISSCGR